MIAETSQFALLGAGARTHPRREVLGEGNVAAVALFREDLLCGIDAQKADLLAEHHEAVRRLAEVFGTPPLLNRLV